MHVFYLEAPSAKQQNSLLFIRYKDERIRDEINGSSADGFRGANLDHCHLFHSAHTDFTHVYVWSLRKKCERMIAEILNEKERKRVRSRGNKRPLAGVARMAPVWKCESGSPQLASLIFILFSSNSVFFPARRGRFAIERLPPDTYTHFFLSLC